MDAASASLMAQCEQEGQALSAALGQGASRCTSTPAPALEIAGAPSELQSALSNLVSNAVRYTPAGGTHRTCSWRELPDGRGEFSVRDTGPGIAPEHISAADRALLPRRPQPLARNRRHRPGPGHREARGAAPRRRAEDREHARRGLDLRDRVPRQPRCAPVSRRLARRTARHRISGRIRPSSASAIVLAGPEGGGRVLRRPRPQAA